MALGIFCYEAEGWKTLDAGGSLESLACLLVTSDDLVVEYKIWIRYIDMFGLFHDEMKHSGWFLEGSGFCHTDC